MLLCVWQPSVLQAAIEEDIAAGLLPCYLCATIGTTSSCAGEKQSLQGQSLTAS